MTGLLEIKEKIKNLYGKYDIYINSLLKFILGLCVFFSINENIGYMEKLSGTSVTLVLALACSIMPINAMIFLAAVLVILHLYALAMEIAVVGLVLFLLLGLLYFRFAPQNGYYTVLTSVCLQFNLGPVMPITAGLLGEVCTSIAVLCGTVVWYFLKGVKENASVLGDSGKDTAITSKYTAALNQLMDNKEMYLVLITFVLVTIVVLFIRRLSIDHAWTVAIIVGCLTNFIVLFAGYVILGLYGRIAGLIIGSVASLVVALLLEFLFFNLDYTRTERVRFEDDEYYYYVKAVPKIYVAEKEKQVKTFGGKGKERISRKQLSEDMDISEELLR